MNAKLKAMLRAKVKAGKILVTVADNHRKVSIGGHKMDILDVTRLIFGREATEKDIYDYWKVQAPIYGWETLGERYDRMYPDQEEPQTVH